MPIDPYEQKIICTVLDEDYQKLKNNLHHGQLTLIVRSFIKSIGQLIEEEGKANIYAWTDSESSLILPPPKK